MKKSIFKGLSFGLTSGVITTLGLIVGLNAGTHSQAIVIGGVMTIAIADSFSDAFGIHVSEEAEKENTKKQVWMATIFTFVFKFLFAMSFLIPILLLPLTQAIVASVIWGSLLLSAISIKIAKENKESVRKVVIEHNLIFILVIVLTNYIGSLISLHLV
ncbi:MAG: VIT1/CCC1 transporter family protein [Candidatus Diapherotrites archaeon]